MARSVNFTVGNRRIRSGKTNYRTRLRLLKSSMPRLVVRKSLKNTLAQVVEYQQVGDKVIVAADARMLKGFGWKGSPGNMPSAYLVGLLVGKRAKEKGMRSMILDIGQNKSVKGSRVYAVLKGVVDAGISVPHSDAVIPDDSRIKGEHIASFAGLLGDKARKAFACYEKQGVAPKDLPMLVEQVKKSILGT
ncbi:TPA: 50S ribosomal protein L18 [Candidatus Woesearchaeota archaeon]|nr:50S ribosomal protein L18 [Candidatus Woesearchaeota archaeon]HII68293.1 50S ribosomal protein L18 [Candidatus Woesearchaeota archaeon]